MRRRIPIWRSPRSSGGRRTSSDHVLEGEKEMPRPPRRGRGLHPEDLGGGPDDLPCLSERSTGRGCPTSDFRPSMPSSTVIPPACANGSFSPIPTTRRPMPPPRPADQPRIAADRSPISTWSPFPSPLKTTIPTSSRCWRWRESPSRRRSGRRRIPSSSAAASPSR